VGRTSAAVKERYNAKAYDRIYVRLQKGEKDLLEEKAKSLGYPSVNSFVADAIKNFNGQ
jgi:uncharacterized protein (DUF1778 family)